MRLFAAAAAGATALIAAAPPHHTREIGRGQVRFDGHGPEWWAMRWRREHRRAAALQRRLASSRTASFLSPFEAVRLIFGPYAQQAQRVVACESGWNVYASNGQYLGLFQMGSRERAMYGHGDALAQARAAYVYFVVSGRSWRPWSCKP